jgi:hypothetical protein
VRRAHASQQERGAQARAGAEFEDGAAGLGGREGGEEPAVFRRRGHGEALGGGPATETYEPSGLPDGQPFGSAVEAYDTAAIVHLTEYAE